MRTRRVVLLASAGLLLAAIPVLAHHSFQAEYDDSHTIMLMGKVTKVEWKNPHVLLWVDVKDDRGEIANWEMELNSPNILMTQGWRLDSLKPGDQVTVAGFAARNGAKILSARKITLEGR